MCSVLYSLFVLIMISTLLAKQICSISIPSTLFKFQTFTLRVFIDKNYVVQHNLTDDDIVTSVVHAKLCRKLDPNSVVTCCRFCCPLKPVIEIRASSQSAIGPFSSKEGNLLEYVFDKCKTNCSSSRDHLHSELFFVIDSLPEIRVASLPFIIRARKKASTSIDHRNFNIL